MTLTDLASIGSFVSGVAVVASLVYLAIQIRQNTRGLQQQVHQGRLERLFDITNMIIEPTFMPVWLKGRVGDPDMTASERGRFVFFARAHVMTLEENFLSGEENLMHESRKKHTHLAVRQILTGPGYRALYGIMRDDLDPRFVAFADEVVRADALSMLEMGVPWAQAVARERASFEMKAATKGESAP